MTKIQTTNRDPKFHEFPPKDLINNVREGRLFYKSNQELYLINACISGTICPITASDLLAVSSAVIEGNITVSGSVELGTDCSDIINLNGQVTASCGISSSQDIIGANITASGDLVVEGDLIVNEVISDIDLDGSVTIGDLCEDVFTIVSQVTASCAFNATASFITSSFIGDGSGLTGIDISDGTNLAVSDTTSQTGINLTLTNDTISGVLTGLTTTSDVQFADLTTTGNTILGNACTDQITLNGRVTASCVISQSSDNDIYAGGDIYLHSQKAIKWANQGDTFIEALSNDIHIKPLDDLVLGVSGNVNFTSGGLQYASFRGANKNLAVGFAQFAEPANSIHTYGSIFASGSTKGGPAGHITASGNISSSGTDSVIGGNVTLSEDCTDRILLKGGVTASCGITGSFVGDGSGLTLLTIPEIDISDGTNLVAGTNITLVDDTLNVDDAFLVNNGNDTTTGTITAAGFTTVGTILTQNLTASGFISSSGDLLVGGDTTLGNACTDIITLAGQVTASCGITGSFVGDGSGLTGITILEGDISASNISASTNLTSLGDTFLGSNFNDTIELKGKVTASCVFSSSENIVGQNFYGISGQATFNTILGSAGITASNNLFCQGDTILGNHCNDIIELVGKVTASCIISSSDAIIASDLTISDDVVIKDDLRVDGDIDLNGNIVGDSNSNISGINDLTVVGDTTLGNACTDIITLSGQVTASCGITGSFIGDGSGLTGITADASIDGTDTHILFFDGDDNPAGEAAFTYNKTQNSITAVTNITASGEIKAEHLLSTDDAYITDNLTVGDDILVGDNIKHLGDTNTEIAFTTGKIESTAKQISFVGPVTCSSAVSASGTGSFTGGLLVGEPSSSTALDAGDRAFVTIRQQTPRTGQTHVMLVENSTGSMVTTQYNDANDGVLIKLNYDNTQPFSSLDGNAFVTFTAQGTIAGSIIANESNVEYLDSSDKRLKNNIIDTEWGLKDLLKIKVKDFTWKSDPKKDKYVDTGVIAQELKEVYPKAVRDFEVKNEKDNIKEGHPDYRYMMVNYDKMIPLLIQSVQDQQKQIEILTQKVKNLENGKSRSG